jgi:predicted site-specific integrase-resolvase
MTRDRPYVTASFVGEAYGVGADTVRRWAKDGLIPAVVLPSGQLRFRRADFENIGATPPAVPVKPESAKVTAA